MTIIRPPAVAGLFYPADTEELTLDIQQLLTEAKHHNLTPKVLIVPHAGYVYSGAIAATAYNTLRPAAATIKRVVLLGPTHRVAVHGLALPDADVFKTPLGQVKLDKDAIQAIAHLPQITISAEAHAMEHSLEVQLPFLQCVLTEFTLLPLAVGMASLATVGAGYRFRWT